MDFIQKTLFFEPLVPEILSDRRINLSERTILSLVIMLSRQKGYCFATNGYLAVNLNCSTATISNSIKKLHELGYIIKNEPDPRHGGRCYRRYVRSDLYYQGASSQIKSSLLNTPNQSSVKSKHNIISKNELNIKYISLEEEKKLVQKNLNSTFLKWRYYNSLKKIYENKNSIEWSKTNINELIKLSNRMNQFIEAEFGKVQISPYNKSLKIFELLLSCKPKYFTDCLPSTFSRFFSKVICHEKFQTDLKNIYSNQTENSFI